MLPCQRARQRVQRDALACRRSTTALAAATERHRSAPVTRFPGRNYAGTGVTRSPPSQCSGRYDPQTGRNAGRAFSTRSRPGAGLTTPPAGTASPLSAGVTRRRPFGRGLGVCNDSGDDCQGRGTLLVTDPGALRRIRINSALQAFAECLLRSEGDQTAASPRNGAMGR